MARARLIFEINKTFVGTAEEILSQRLALKRQLEREGWSVDDFKSDVDWIEPRLAPGACCSTGSKAPDDPQRSA
jgi:hypothetical protein